MQPDICARQLVGSSNQFDVIKCTTSLHQIYLLTSQSATASAHVWWWLASISLSIGHLLSHSRFSFRSHQFDYLGLAIYMSGNHHLPTSAMLTIQRTCLMIIDGLAHLHALAICWAIHGLALEVINLITWAQLYICQSAHEIKLMMFVWWECNQNDDFYITYICNYFIYYYFDHMDNLLRNYQFRYIRLITLYRFPSWFHVLFAKQSSIWH